MFSAGSTGGFDFTLGKGLKEEARLKYIDHGNGSGSSEKKEDLMYDQMGILNLKL
jgi:hypothetical protein